ncbi:hypothetical protein Pelo_19118 [Pelomyxa schiedti]|nr:hypothetical protein Pelo_19118 [Pelomyxa schiedti]
MTGELGGGIVGAPSAVLAAFSWFAVLQRTRWERTGHVFCGQCVDAAVVRSPELVVESRVVRTLQAVLQIRW